MYIITPTLVLNLSRHLVPWTGNFSVTNPALACLCSDVITSVSWTWTFHQHTDNNPAVHEWLVYRRINLFSVVGWTWNLSWTAVWWILSYCPIWHCNCCPSISSLTSGHLYTSLLCFLHFLTLSFYIRTRLINHWCICLSIRIKKLQHGHYKKQCCYYTVCPPESTDKIKNVNY